MVKLKDVFPHGTGFVLVFEYMLSDLSEVIRNSQRPLTESQVKGYMMMLLKGVAFCHENSIMHRVRPSVSQTYHLFVAARHNKKLTATNCILIEGLNFYSKNVGDLKFTIQI